MGWWLRHTDDAYNRMCKWSKYGRPVFWRKKGSCRNGLQGFCTIVLSKIKAVSTVPVGSSLWISPTIIFFPIHVPKFYFKRSWDSYGDGTNTGSCTCLTRRGSLPTQRWYVAHQQAVGVGAVLLEKLPLGFHRSLQPGMDCWRLYINLPGPAWACQVSQ